jgi:uncharacterized OB-fold protein
VSTTEDLLYPALDPDAAAFFGPVERGELHVQQCDSCTRLRFPPRPMCPWCHSFDSSWVPTTGRGTVWSYCVPHAPLLPAYTDLAPYVVIVVALDDDPRIRIVSSMVKEPNGPFNEVDASDVHIGQRVRLVAGPIVHGITLTGFMPE